MAVIWTRPAVRHLEEISDYVAAHDKAAAARLLHRIGVAVSHLASHPMMGRAGRRAGTRELVIPNTAYVVPYAIRGGDVIVLAVFHAARQWPEVF
jgi:plasmid stabilization system protein ParE